MPQVKFWAANGIISISLEKRTPYLISDFHISHRPITDGAYGEPIKIPSLDAKEIDTLIRSLEFLREESE
jgi:hypothetical protein